MPQKYVTVDGMATLVHHRGRTTLPGTPPDLSRQPVVLCAHGAGANGNEFAGLLDALDAAGAGTPVAYDQPGHGRSGSLDSLGAVPAMAAHLRGVASALGITSAVLLGDATLGGAVVLEAALADPGFAQGLVLTGGVPSPGAVTDEMVGELRRITQGKARRNFDPTGFAPTTEREVYQRAFGEWVKTDPRATLGDRRAEQAWDGHGRVGEVAVPVLIVVGEHEDRTAAEALAEQLPQAQVVTVAGAGRRVVLEQPAALAAEIATFIGSLAEAAA